MSRVAKDGASMQEAARLRDLHARLFRELKDTPKGCSPDPMGRKRRVQNLGKAEGARACSQSPYEDRVILRGLLGT